MTYQRPHSRRSDVFSDSQPRIGGRREHVLAAGELGVAKVVFFSMGSAAPLMVLAGVVVTGVAVTGLLGISLAFVLVAAILWVFSYGYVAMAAKIGSAGALYSLIAQGWSKQVGVGAAWLAMVSYNLLQVGLYGVVGAAADPVARQFVGVEVAWWVWAYLAWVGVTALGQMKVDVNGTVMAVLMVVEIAVMVVYSIAFVADPGPEGVVFTTFSWAGFFGSAGAILIVMGLLGNLGFESSVVYSEESKDSARTVRTATFVTIGLIAVLYSVGSWAMSVAVGPASFVQASRAQGTGLLFGLATGRFGSFGSFAGTVGSFFFLTSILAALLAFHNTTARYMFALGRELLLPESLGNTSSRFAPWVASLVQSGIGLAVITVYAVAGWDPLVQLFYWLGTLGGIGVLALLMLTSLTMIFYFTRTQDHGHGAWTAYMSPLVSFIVLLAVLVVALDNVPTLLGVPAAHPLTWIVPTVLIATFALGLVWASVLRVWRPDIYRYIGMGPRSAAARATNAVVERLA